MEDFDFSNLDKVDFDAVEESTKANADKKAQQEAEKIEGLREGANDCVGSCTI
jgi:hypothetical protein